MYTMSSPTDQNMKPREAKQNHSQNKTKKKNKFGAYTSSMIKHQ